MKLSLENISLCAVGALLSAFAISVGMDTAKLFKKKSKGNER